MKHKTAVIFARELAVAGIIKVSIVVMSLYFELLATKCQFCRQGLGILAMFVLDFTIQYLQSGSGCNDENTNLAKNSPEHHIGKNYNTMQETLLEKWQIFRKIANLEIFTEKSCKNLPMAL